ncbi:MAG: AIR synthase-related protein [Minisyncoccia bacterium]
MKGEINRLDGVDLDAGNDFSAFCYEVIKRTWKNCPFVEIVADKREDYFRGDLGWRPVNLPDGWWLDDAPDGVGSKSMLTVAAWKPDQAASDLVAMTLGDIVRKGGVPLKLGNVLDARMLGAPGSRTNRFFRTAVRGLLEAALKERIVLYRGETAELGSCVGSEFESDVAYNWAGFAVGAKHPELAIDGGKLAPEQIIVAIKENGFRSNGFSAMRQAFRVRFGERWWHNPEAKPFIAAAAEPSVLWSHFLARMNGWFSPKFEPIVPMTAIAHITGGGIPEKFGADLLFRYGLSATLNTLWEPPEIMLECKEWLKMGEEEFFKIFNGGQGALIVVPTEENAQTFITLAHEYGLRAKIAGKICKPEGEPTLTIVRNSAEKPAVYFPS